MTSRRSAFRWDWLAGVVGLVTIFAGCGDCTTEARPGIVLAVVDRSTHRPTTVAPEIVVAEGGYVETYPRAGFEAVPLEYYGFATERPGKYTVTVTVPGFHRWTEVVEVSLGRCHVETREITVRLIRQ